MLKQDFKPNSNQNSAAEVFCLRFEPDSKYLPDDYSAKRDDKRSASDDQRDDEDGRVQKRKGNTCGQGIDAGGDGKQKKLTVIHRQVTGFFLSISFAVCAPNHFRTDEGEENKGNPVIQEINLRIKLPAKKPSQERALTLESPRKRGRSQWRIRIEFSACTDLFPSPRRTRPWIGRWQ